MPFPDKGAWKVVGEAGCGVSSFLVDLVIDRIDQGADPSGILVIAASKQSGGLLRRELSQRLADYSAHSTMVRTVHSLAFALLRDSQDVAAGADCEVQEPLRLITGAEQDAVIRELLEGHVAAGGGMWPEFVRPALGMVGFARQLRDFMLRAGERGQGPEDLERLGQEWGRPMWAAAGRFMREYEEVMALAGRHSLSAAELVAEVAANPKLVEGHPWHTVVVDDAQLLDPNAGRLIQALSVSADLTVVAGDPSQAVFGFRGAKAGFLENFPGQELRLVQPQRRPEPACIAVVDSQATQRDVLADFVRRRHLEDGVAWSEIAVVVRGGGEIGQVRRTLLAAGVPVHIDPTDVILAEQRLVRAVLQAVRGLYEPLDNAEIEELITGPVGGADPVTLRRLIRGLRRWRPQQRGIESLRQVLTGPLPDFGGLLTEQELGTLERVRRVFEQGRAALGRPASAAAPESEGAKAEEDAARPSSSIEQVLWAVWEATDLSRRLQAAALRGGATGSQADRDLDAMMALFDAAGDFSERYPEAPIESFVRHIVEQELPTGVRDRRAARPEAVEVISAHGAVGREWDTVAVVGAQEGSWPSLGETGSLFEQAELIDLLDSDIAPGSHVSHLADRLAEERRLFHVATTRHRARMLIVAIDAPDADTVFEPSRFIEEFAGPGLDVPGRLARRAAADRLKRTSLARGMGLDVPPVVELGEQEPGELEPLQVSVLSVPAFVAGLRRIVEAPRAGAATEGNAGEEGAAASAGVTDTERQQAARQLARLAAAGVPGADPAQWWAAREVASTGQLPAVPTVSPSRVEALLQCPLNAVLSRVGEEEGTPLALLRGNMAHAFLEAVGRGGDVEEAYGLTRGAYAQVLDVPEWQREYELGRFDRLLDRIVEWVTSSRSALRLVGSEVPVHVEVAPEVTVHGYIDRLEQSVGDAAAGGSGEDYYTVDLKTGKQAVSEAEAQANAQLATYQLALRAGQVVDTDDGPRVVTALPGTKPLAYGGGILFYPATDAAGVTVRQQAAWEEDDLRQFAAKLPSLVREMRGPTLTARENSGCSSCAIKTLCPVQPEGRMTTDV